MAAASTLVTDRLRLRPWAQGDLALLQRLACTPAVVRHVGDGSAWSAARIAQVAQANTEHWRAHSFGWRVALPIGGGQPVGLFALSFAGAGAGVDAGEHELGWWLAPEAWGRGLAREGAAAMRDEAFERVGAPSVVARIAPANVRSLAVAAAIGLRHERDGVGRHGEPIRILRLRRASWQPPAARPRPGSRPRAPRG
ncbi:MAG TPA: GNAT family N-acetyltransferase [Solirubrobacteraceae bacterium]|nr:GNAT family N-acetyltransferase [Solirubrobacteraceae bacterium]